MSVSYFLNKKIRIGDLKKTGLFNIENTMEKNSPYEFIIESKKYNDSWLGVIKLSAENENDNEDNLIIEELEGRYSRGGGCCLLEACDKLNFMFVTDEDIDGIIRTNEEEITDEMFEYRTEEFRKALSTLPEEQK